MDNEGQKRTSRAFIWKFESKHIRMRSNKLLFMSMKKIAFSRFAPAQAVCFELILLHIVMSG
jgi:hypothetical protein